MKIEVDQKDRDVSILVSDKDDEFAISLSEHTGKVLYDELKKIFNIVDCAICNFFESETCHTCIWNDHYSDHYKK